jgi:hypothetical protein
VEHVDPREQRSDEVLVDACLYLVKAIDVPVWFIVRRVCEKFERATEDVVLYTGPGTRREWRRHEGALFGDL